MSNTFLHSKINNQIYYSYPEQKLFLSSFHIRALENFRSGYVELFSCWQSRSDIVRCWLFCKLWSQREEYTGQTTHKPMRVFHSQSTTLSSRLLSKQIVTANMLCTEVSPTTGDDMVMSVSCPRPQPDVHLPRNVTYCGDTDTNNFERFFWY